MVHAPNLDNPDIAVIKDSERRLDHRFLRKEGSVWYAYFAASPFPDELAVPGDYIEGAKNKSWSTRLREIIRPASMYQPPRCGM